ncbi:hypothetical protein BGW42_007406, partial [Actinomortierella wolfii]
VHPQEYYGDASMLNFFSEASCGLCIVQHQPDGGCLIFETLRNGGPIAFSLSRTAAGATTDMEIDIDTKFPLFAREEEHDGSKEERIRILSTSVEKVASLLKKNKNLQARLVSNPAVSALKALSPVEEERYKEIEIQHEAAERERAELELPKFTDMDLLVRSAHKVINDDDDDDDDDVRESFKQLMAPIDASYSMSKTVAAACFYKLLITKLTLVKQYCVFILLNCC